MERIGQCDGVLDFEAGEQVPNCFGVFLFAIHPDQGLKRLTAKGVLRERF